MQLTQSILITESFKSVHPYAIVNLDGSHKLYASTIECCARTLEQAGDSRKDIDHDATVVDVRNGRIYTRSEALLTLKFHVGTIAEADSVFANLYKNWRT